MIKIFNYELTEKELRDLYKQITGLDDSEKFNTNDLVCYLTNIIMEKYDCGEFYINGNLITSWNYNEGKEQFEFYDTNNQLVCSIAESTKDYDHFVKKYTNDLSQWVRLIDLFADDEDN